MPQLFSVTLEFTKNMYPLRHNYESMNNKPHYHFTPLNMKPRPTLIFLFTLSRSAGAHYTSVRPSPPGGLPSYKQRGTGLVENILDPARVCHQGCPEQHFKLKSMCVTYSLSGHKLSKSCAAVEPSAPLKQSSPLVMWVHYRKRPILPLLVSPSFTSPWTGINATPSLGSRHDPNVSTRTELVSEG